MPNYLIAAAWEILKSAVSVSEARSVLLIRWLDSATIGHMPLTMLKHKHR